MPNRSASGSAALPRTPVSRRRAARPSAGLPTSAVIHAREKRLDQLLDFVGFVAKPMPLSLLLDEAPKKIAAIVGADIASLYLLEGDGDDLVMRGNVGFPMGVRG